MANTSFLIFGKLTISLKHGLENGQIPNSTILANTQEYLNIIRKVNNFRSIKQKTTGNRSFYLQVTTNA